MQIRIEWWSMGRKCIRWHKYTLKGKQLHNYYEYWLQIWKLYIEIIFDRSHAYVRSSNIY
jgi:hypothetical protein